jgi:hypothetical protein
MEGAGEEAIVAYFSVLFRRYLEESEQSHDVREAAATLEARTMYLLNTSLMYLLASQLNCSIKSRRYVETGNTTGLGVPVRPKNKTLKSPVEKSSFQTAESPNINIKD